MNDNCETETVFQQLLLSNHNLLNWGFPCGSVVQNTPINARDVGLIPGSGRFPGEGNGNPLQYSYLGNPMDREAWWATVHRVTKESDTTQRLKSNKKKCG